MNSKRNQYIKYTRAELENYTQQTESCVQKIKCIEPIRFTPTIISTFQASIGRILGRKIGKFDMKLNGIVLDFRNTRVLNSQSAVRQDSPHSVINVETNFYVFSPRKDAIVTGIVKYINRISSDTNVISVVIYRVFNVKVNIKGKVKQELEKNQEIQIRVRDFHFDNVIPFIEGEIVGTNILVKSKKLFEDTNDSGISENSTSSRSQNIDVKKRRESSGKIRKRDSTDAIDLNLSKRIKSEPVTDDEDPEIFLAKYLATQNNKNTSSTSFALKQEKLDLEISLKQETKSKKKRKRLIEGDDFETSLQTIINAGYIKQEK